MNEVNAFAVNSNQIILECLKEHGKGKLFFRTDGLEFETRRARVREKFLNVPESHALYFHEDLLSVPAL
jgi:hypothetical protein